MKPSLFVPQKLVSGFGLKLQVSWFRLSSCKFLGRGLSGELKRKTGRFLLSQHHGKRSYKPLFHNADARAFITSQDADREPCR